MATGIGARIELEGASSFSQAMKLAAAAAGNLKAELANVASQFDKNDKSTASLTAQNETLGKSLDLAKQKVSVMDKELSAQRSTLSTLEKSLKDAEGALSKATKEFGENSKEALAAQSAVAKAQVAYEKQAIAVQKLEKDYNEAQKDVNTFTKEIKENETAMKSAGNSSDKAADDIEKVGKAAESGKSGISVMTVALGNLISNAIISGLRKLGNALKDAISTGIQFNMQIETYNASFTSLLGSQEKAVDMVQQLRDSFKGTVFNISETAAAAQTLLGYGVTAENVIPVLKYLGDISLGNKDNFNSLALAFGQVQAKGKLAGEEVRQMVNAGFNPLQEIAKMTGKSMEEVTKMMTAGAISAEMVAEAFAHASGEGGLFFGAMENQSKTLTGQLTTLKATVQEGLGKAFEGASSILAEKVIPKLIEFAESVNWEALGEAIAKVINFIVDNGGLIVSVLAGVIAAFVAWKISTIDVNAALSANPIILIVGLIAALVVAIVHLYNTNEDFRNGVTKAWEGIKEVVVKVYKAFEPIIEGIKTAFGGLVTFFSGLWEVIKGIFSAVFAVIKALITGDFETLAEELAGIWESIKNGISTMWEGIKQFFDGIFTAIGEAFKLFWNGIKDFFIGLWEGIVNNVVEKWEAIVAFFTVIIPNLINSISEWFSELPGKIWEWLTKIIDDIIQWGKDLASKALQAAQNVFNNIVDTIKALPGKMLETGKNLVQGIWNGISDGATWLWNKLKEWCNNIVDSIKGFFGINSPAKVLAAEVGKFMPPGISLGFEDAMPAAIKDMESSMDSAVDALAKAAPEIQASVTSGFDSLPDPKGSSRQTAGVSINPVFHITIHADGNTDDSGWREISDQMIEEISQKLEMLTQKQLRAIGGTS